MEPTNSGQLITRPVRVAVLDDHQMVAEGIASRLTATEDRLDVVANDLLMMT